MKKAVRMLKCQKGDAIFFIFIIIFVIVTLAAIIIEYYRINSMYQQAEYELQRGVNSAVEYSIMDEYRKDGITRMDDALADQALYDYFNQSMGLDRELAKYSEGRLVYRLEIQTVSATEEPPRLTIEGVIHTRSIFNFLAGEIRMPFVISSSNNRTN